MNVIGTCSLCGGQVVIPELWGGVIPPTPTCTRCRAVAASSGPIIPMRRVDGPGSAWTSGAIPNQEVRYHSMAKQTAVRPFCGRPGCCGDEPRSAQDLNFPSTWRLGA